MTGGTRYLVTGGCGFLGAHVARVLLERGHEVVAFDPQPEGNALDTVLTPAEQERVVRVAGDVVDLPLLLRTCREHDVARIVHLAFVMGVVGENPTRVIAVNCQGAANVFEAAALLGLEKVVWSGSNAVFGPPALYPTAHLPADAPHAPNTLYGASKSFVERLAAHYVASRGVVAGGVRLVILYGPGRMRGGAMHVNEVLFAALAGTPLEVPYASELQNFLYVEDAARCLALLSELGATGTLVYNVSGEACTVWEYAEAVARVVPGAAFTAGGGEFPARLTWRFDVTALEREVGFEPRFTVESGIREWVRTLGT
jgi:nucleoside-diphosphate-sugar epimerase